MKTRHSMLKGEIILILVTMLWGATFPILKIALNDFPPLYLVGFRFLAAALIFLPLSWGDPQWRNPRALRAGLILGAFMLIGYALQTIGLETTTSARSAFFTYSFAFYVPFLQFFILKRLPGIIQIAALALAILGMYLFASPESGGLRPGDILTLIGAAGYSSYVVLLDPYSTEYSPRVLTTMQFAVTGALSLVLAMSGSVATGRLPDIHLRLPGLLAIGYLIVFGTVIALFLMNRYQKETTPVRATIIYALEPVFSILFGFLILGETAGFSELLGGLCIAGGVVASTMGTLFSEPQQGNGTGSE